MKNIHKINENIYITNDEEIKEGDWVISDQMFLSPLYDAIGKIEIISGEIKKIIQSDGSWYWTELETKKIILTTDQDLIKDGVQPIDDEFLQWFVNNPNCEEVEVKIDCDICALECTTNKCPNLFYKIIIPKEEPKDVVLGYKTSLDAQMLDKIEPKQEEIDFYAKELMLEKERAYKQETLEEVELAILFHNTYEKLAPSFGYETREDTKYFDITTPNGKLMIAVCKEIIKWQQERMYSEEDMRLAIKKARDISDGKYCFDAEDISGCTEVCTYDWKFNMSEDLIIEQFKKK